MWSFVLGASVFASGAIFGWASHRAMMSDILDRYDD